jgi:hypothetical protein
VPEGVVIEVRVLGRKAIVGLIHVESSSSTYKSVQGAARSLHASFRQALRPSSSRFKRLSTGGPIGHEARFYTARTKSGGVSADIYLILWRYRTVRASVVGGGLPNTVRPEILVDLARKQQRRIEAELR